MPTHDIMEHRSEKRVDDRLKQILGRSKRAWGRVEGRTERTPAGRDHTEEKGG